jgi:hypothetical protein
LHQFLLVLVMVCGVLLPCAARCAEIDRALAIVDPLTLRELDLREHRSEAVPHPGFALGRMLGEPVLSDSEISNDKLFALPSMTAVRGAIDQAIAQYAARRLAGEPGLSLGVGAAHDVRLFDRDLLFSARTRFSLAGVVNRMDRAFRAPENCGEMRLIYRLRRVDEAAGAEPARLLPMTLNLVLRATRGEDDDRQQRCADAARRWLDAAELPQSGVEWADRLLAPGGPLHPLTQESIDRIEINLQIAHTPQSESRAFRTDYLLSSFRYQPESRRFEPALLENQIDSDRLRADDALAQAFKRWLLAPEQLAALDRGTITIPDQFLAPSALAATPVGFAPSPRQPAFGLVSSDQQRPAMFELSDFVTALRAPPSPGVTFETLRSPAGFARRLNDISCAGCHQTRGIGGFHFPGVDTRATATAPSVPASPHFEGEQSRRRDILIALREKRMPDYSRGFADRPQLRGAAALARDDGWGAHCARTEVGGAVDPSFAAWRCAEGLVCEPVGADGAHAPIGMCFVPSRWTTARAHSSPPRHRRAQLRDGGLIIAGAA